MGIRHILGRLALLASAASTLPAENYAFVFHGVQSTVSIYDADSMSLRGTPAVGPGARRAFGVPDPAAPTQFLKFYVVTTSSVVVLNPTAPFNVRATLALAGTVPPGSPNPAALSPDGTKLLVAAGDTVHVINTRDAVDTVNLSIPMAQNPTGIVITPNSKHAYVMSNDSTIGRIIELLPGVQLLSLTVPLPPGNLPLAIGMAPNGARVYMTAQGQLYDIDRLTNFPGPAISNLFTNGSSIVFDPDPVVTTAVLNALSSAPIANLVARSIGINPFTTFGLNISKIVLPGSNRMYLMAGSPGRVFTAFLTSGGPVTEVTLPEFGINGVDMENSPDGRWIFSVWSTGRLSRFDPSGVAPASQTSTQLAPSGLSLVYAPSLAVSQFEIYGGNAQTGASGVSLSAPLAVRARGSNNLPAFNQTVTFSVNASAATVREPSVATNLNGVAETFVVLNVSTAVEVTATLISGSFTSSRVFTLNATGAPGAADGLTKVSGDRQTAVSGSQFPFPLVVSAKSGLIPVPNLTISAIFSGTVSCPASALTVGNGEATFVCTAGVIAATSSAEIQMTDPAGRMLTEAFRVQLVTSPAETASSLDLESDANLVGTVRETLVNALRFRAFKPNGQTASDVGIALSAPEFDLTFEPRIPVTGSGGSASASIALGCRSGQGVIRAIGLTPAMPIRNINFVVNPGPPTQMIKRQGDGQSGNPGTLLNRPGQALLTRLADSCGNGIARERLEWRVIPPEAASLENVFPLTNEQGEASALVRLGNRAGPFSITATAAGVTATFNLSVNIQASRLVLLSGNNQSIVLGQAAAQQIMVEATDANLIPAAGVDVTFRVTGGAATVDPARVPTNAQGRAAATVRAGALLGTITVVAEGAGQSVTFTFTTLGRVPVAAVAAFVNGASFRQGWTPGSLGSIFGSGLMEGIAGVVAADRAPFPTVLRGVRITVDGFDAPLISLVKQGDQEQVNLQVPFGVPVGSATVVIDNNGSRTTITGVRILAVLPGIFEFTLEGVRLAAALHADFSVVTPQNPARPGEVILLFLTGMGTTNPVVGTNVAGPVPLANTVRVPAVGLNGEGQEVLASVYAPGLYTAYQINFRVARNVRAGLADLAVVVDGVAGQDSKLPISATPLP